MKINFKTILIIFLVALLGSGLGTFGIMSLYENNVSKKNTPITINEVSYNNKQKNDYTKAIDTAYNTVVEITCTVETSYSSSFFFFGGGTQIATMSGSGVIISDDGYIVTNNHVVEGVKNEDSIKVKLYTGDIYDAKIIGCDVRTDLAVIKIEENNLPYSSFVNSDDLYMGEEVIAIGNPLGLGISCSNGIISALEKEIYINNVYLTVLQTNAAVNQGNSGGGLFDLNGNIVGIVNAKTSSNSSLQANVEGMGYAIPSNTVQRIVNEIVDYGYVKDRAALGIKVYSGDSYYSTNGVIVTDVIKHGSADQAGIKVNDIITAVDGTVVNTYADLSKLLDGLKVGDEVEVTVNRDGQLRNFQLILQQSESN